MKGPPLAGWHIGGRLLSSGCLESDGGRSGSPSASQGSTGAEESPGAADAEEAAGVKEAPGAADAEKAAGA